MVLIAPDSFYRPMGGGGGGDGGGTGGGGEGGGGAAGILLGRTTYQMFEPAWSTRVTGSPLTNIATAIQKEPAILANRAVGADARRGQS